MDHGSRRDAEDRQRREELEESLGRSDAAELARRLEAYREASAAGVSDVARLRDRWTQRPRRFPRLAPWLVLAVAASLVLVFGRQWFSGTTEAPGDTTPKLASLPVVAQTGQLFAVHDAGLHPVRGRTQIPVGTKLCAGAGGCELRFGREDKSVLHLTPQAVVTVLDVEAPLFEFADLSTSVVAEGDVDFVVHGERFRCRQSKARVVPCCGASKHAAQIVPVETGVMICRPPATGEGQAGGQLQFRSCNRPHYVGICEICNPSKAGKPRRIK